jgi:hypothetical protein
MVHASRLAAWAIPVLVGFLIVPAPAQSNIPAISAISPTRGPEGTRVQIIGVCFQGASAVLFGSTASTFKIISPEKIIAIVPHHSATSKITVVSARGRTESVVSFLVDNDPRIPEEVSYKAGYINPVPPPIDFHSALLWGIAIADVRVAGYEAAEVRIASTKLTCRIDGKDVVLNDDAGKLRGGLYRRQPWFGTDRHEDIPRKYEEKDHVTVLRVGSRRDRVWHFWSASSRVSLPTGKLEGCTVTARVKISSGALLQMGMDYWRSATVPYGAGGNNHEAGASSWYFPSSEWQEATFTDVGGVQF